MRSFIVAVSAFLVSLIWFSLSLDAAEEEVLPLSDDITNALNKEACTTRTFSNLPLYFIENQGQLDEQVDYYLKGADKTLYFTSEGITFLLKGEFGGEIQRWVVKLDFVGANCVTPRGAEKQEAVFSYFKGRREDWHTGIPTYSKLVYKDLWPGIDLVYSGTVNELKYEFIVQPGTDPQAIAFAFRGADEVLLNADGSLQVSTPAGGFEDGVPYAYQDIDSEQVEVAMSYAPRGRTDDGTFLYGFDIGDYDTSKILVLDPVVLVYCGYIGGSGGWEYCQGVAVDDQKRAYVVGWTDSDEGNPPGSNFPVVVGPDLTFNGGGSPYYSDAFVARVKPDFTELEYCGYIGGSAFDRGHGIVVDDEYRAYIVGTTVSDESTFPVKNGPDLTHNGHGDAFVARVNPDGNDLEFCGYIGGSHSDEGHGIALAKDQLDYRVYVTGETDSDEGNPPGTNFPVKVGPDLTYNGGSSVDPRDAFVACMMAETLEIKYCGYIGGTENDRGFGVAVDQSYRAYVTGCASSDENSFPVIVGPDLIYNGGLHDAFVACVTADGSYFEYCGYIGGIDNESGSGVAVDQNDRAYVAGFTLSDEMTFPVRVGPDLEHNGDQDAYVARILPDGSSLEYCGYIGGISRDNSNGIALDQNFCAYVTGTVNSDETTFPVLVGPDLTYNGNGDAYVARVNAAGDGLIFCGYIGGANLDYTYGIAVDDNSNVYVGGQTNSDEISNFPVLVGPDLTYNGGTLDTFVAKVVQTNFHLTIVPDPLQGGQPATFYVTGGKPDKIMTYLVYSVTGEGSTWVPLLNVYLGVKNPHPFANAKTDDLGNWTYSRTIPNVPGLTVWIQAAQENQVTNVVETTIQ